MAWCSSEKKRSWCCLRRCFTVSILAVHTAKFVSTLGIYTSASFFQAGLDHLQLQRLVPTFVSGFRMRLWHWVFLWVLYTCLCTSKDKVGWVQEVLGEYTASLVASEMTDRATPVSASISSLLRWSTSVRLWGLVSTCPACGAWTCPYCYSLQDHSVHVSLGCTRISCQGS